MKYPLAYIQGPPGTGKTNTIINTIVTAFFNERTVLFASNNNHPIDGVYEKLSHLKYKMCIRDRVKPVTLEDGYGKIDVYLLPFLKPAHVRRFFPEEEIDSYTEAMRVAIDYLDLDLSRRNILVTHQFVTGAVRSDSEEISVGGADNVDASVFEAFDYVALGHLHRAQSVTRETRCV